MARCVASLPTRTARQEVQVERQISTSADHWWRSRRPSAGVVSQKSRIGPVHQKIRELLMRIFLRMFGSKSDRWLYEYNIDR